MAPQARSEVTRQKILDAAMDVFSEVGYAAAGLGEVIERAGMTKGALYHHFDSKEALATAIIEQGTNLTSDAFRHVCESTSPALENMIHGVFLVTDLLVSDKTARTAEQLTRGLAEFNSTASQVWSTWLDAMTTQASLASAEGDLREDLDPYVVSESIVNAKPPIRLTEHNQPYEYSFTHSRSVKLSNVTKTSASSRRISADLLILARTVQPSQCRSSTTRFDSASTPESAHNAAGTVWKVSGNASPAKLSRR